MRWILVDIDNVIRFKKDFNTEQKLKVGDTITIDDSQWTIQNMEMIVQQPNKYTGILYVYRVAP